MKSKNIKILLILILCLTMVFTTSVSYATSISSKIDDKQEELDANNNKLNDLSDDMSAINARITKTEAKLATTQKSITAMHEDIADTNENLKKEKSKLEKTEDELDVRLRNIYKGGSLDFIDIFLSSTNISELMSNIEMMQKVYKNDRDLVDSVRESYEKIKAEKEKLVTLQEKLKTKLETLEEEQDELSNDYAKLEKKENKLTTNKEKLEADIDALNAESEALKSDINSNSSSGSYKGGSMLWPVPGHYYVSSPFGYRIHPVLGVSKFHSGIDIPAPSGTSIKAANSGTVMSASYAGSYGNLVMIDHGGGIVSLYGHTSKMLVHAGEHVSKGQTIALVGTTGRSTGNHCHFEVRVNGSPVNPRNYV